jgi:DNA-binding transcriptional LysR family regulator
MKVFVRVAQDLGFAAAARDLHMSTAAVSKHVTALESQIGTRLFDRTTRRVGLTEAGRVYLERCLECLQALEDADASVSELAKSPKGLMRVTAPIDFRENLLPVVAEVMNAHPDIVIDLQLSNRVMDMVEEGIDVGIRIAPSLDGRYVALPLARSRLAIYGAPDYLHRHGFPRRPEDLASHRAIVFAEPRPIDELAFVRGRSEVRVKLNTVMLSNNGEAVSAALRRGVGLAALPAFLARRDLDAGQIVPLLLDWSLPEYRVFAVYPHRRFLSPKVRVFVEALRTAFGDGTRDPWWPESLPRSAPARRSSGWKNGATGAVSGGTGGRAVRPSNANR